MSRHSCQGGIHTQGITFITRKIKPEMLGIWDIGKWRTTTTTTHTWYMSILMAMIKDDGQNRNSIRMMMLGIYIKFCFEFAQHNWWRRRRESGWWLSLDFFFVGLGVSGNLFGLKNPSMFEKTNEEKNKCKENRKHTHKQRRKQINYQTIDTIDRI